MESTPRTGTGETGSDLSKLAVGGFLLSLVALQTLYFYLSQFLAIAASLLQLAFLLVLLTYQSWYIRERSAAK